MRKNNDSNYNPLKSFLDGLFLEIWNESEGIPEDAVYEKINDELYLVPMFKIENESDEKRVAGSYVSKSLVELLGFTEKEFMEGIKRNIRYPVDYLYNGKKLMLTQRIGTESPGRTYFGAAALFYDGVLDEAIKLLGTDEFYVLLFSKPNLILVKREDYDVDEAYSLLEYLDVNSDRMPDWLRVGNFVFEYRDGKIVTVE